MVMIIKIKVELSKHRSYDLTQPITDWLVSELIQFDPLRVDGLNGLVHLIKKIHFFFSQSQQSYIIIVIEI